MIATRRYALDALRYNRSAIESSSGSAVYSKRSYETPLARVVAVHEGAKEILRDSHQVDLRALDATVRSLRGGAQLRGFAEVSAQMRLWSQELHAAVKQVSMLSAEQVNVVSALEKRMRMIGLLSAACNEPAAQRLLAQRLEQARVESAASEEVLRLLRCKVRGQLEDLQQLGLMACVLSMSALIEAAGAGKHSGDLTIVSRDFAERSQKVAENIRRMLASDHRGQT